MDILFAMEVFGSSLFIWLFVGILLLHKKFNRFAKEIKIRNEGIDEH